MLAGQRLRYLTRLVVLRPIAISPRPVPAANQLHCTATAASSPFPAIRRLRGRYAASFHTTNPGPTARPTGVAAAIACLLPSGRGQESPASFSSRADRLPGVGATSSATPPPAHLTPAEELVAEVRIVGNETTTTTQIITNITTRAGRPFNETVVQRDVRNLANLGWFVDVKSLYQRTPQGRIVSSKSSSDRRFAMCSTSATRRSKTRRSASKLC